MADTATLARRELRGYFGSPVAYLFMAAFLGVTLFVFFWVETFFARNVADIRPLFEWMPLLLIFLVAAMTMRGWSEEKRSGTLELLLTAPRSSLELVAGKFLGCLGLVAVSVLLTAPIPITVALLGPLDWGPVLGGYLATFLLASAYIAMGLWISSLTENQIISLIGTLLLGLALYLLGSPPLTQLAGRGVSELLTSLGTGARFDSITRGVLDARDLVYYLSLTAVFLALNVLSLERLRWARGGHRHSRVAGALIVLNLLAVNLWLAPVQSLRIDLTEGNIYSLSDTTDRYLDNLQEPLLIRGYFSAKTHPLLAPLVPQLRDLLREYGVHGDDNVRVEIVDPQTDPEIAEKAAKRYDIKPVPFRTQSKYESSVVSSYFDVLIQYGDEHRVLNFRDLIEIRRHGGDEVRVVLNDPEYRITNNIKKVVSRYRRAGSPFTGIESPVTLRAFISGPERLPEAVKVLKEDFQALLKQWREQAGDKLQVVVENPGSPSGKNARELIRRYGIQPLRTGLLGTPFFFNVILEQGDQQVPVPLPQDLDKAALKTNMEVALERFKPGLLDTIAVYTPGGGSPLARRMGGSGPQFQTLKTALAQNHVVQDTDLKAGHLPAGTDLLLVLAPDSLSEKQLFTLDQFLMRGGTVVISASPYRVNLGRDGLNASAHESGLSEWLQAKGINMKQQFVLDPVSASFPIPVVRRIGGIPVREFSQVDYPYFADIRAPRMARDTAITRGLGQLTVTWASPLVTDQLDEGLSAKPLLRSSKRAWLSDATEITPPMEGEAAPWTAEVGARDQRTLGLAVTGRFQSYFSNKTNPYLKSEKSQDPDSKETPDDTAPVLHSVIPASPKNTRLVLYASSTFASDQVLRLQRLSAGRSYRKPVALFRNTLDWALEDPAMLALRDEVQTARILQPLTETERRFWEYLNYTLAILGLGLLWLIARTLHRRRQAAFLRALNEGEV
ncbi:MAG TPA: Gldg family protein [Alcanivorax sp.]|nr:Gldg family protein [Alcanivorax sp.]